MNCGRVSHDRFAARLLMRSAGAMTLAAITQALNQRGIRSRARRNGDQFDRVTHFLT
jgi:hypothetical protein